MSAATPAIPSAMACGSRWGVTIKASKGPVLESIRLYRLAFASMPRGFLALVAFLLAFPLAAPAAENTLRLATTTSTDNSGLLRAILPMFQAASGIQVMVIAVGTGKAMRLGENGDVDVILAHSRPDEDRFVAQGFGVGRRDVMHNDFVVVGPAADPAAIRGSKDVVAAFRKILASKALFVSRGDDSGTDKMEKRYWSEIGQRPPGRQYLSVGQGMGEVLTIAAQLGAYTLTDRATYGAYRHRLGLELLVEGDPRLFNPYGVIAVNPARHPHVNFEGAMQFIEWLTGPAGRKAIGEFRVAGETLFFPSAR